MKKLFAIPLILVMMPCAFAVDASKLNPDFSLLDPYYASLSLCAQNCSLGACYSVVEASCPSGWTNNSGTCTRTSGTTHDTTNHRYVTAMYGSCSTTDEEHWYCARLCDANTCSTCCSVASGKVVGTCEACNQL